MSALTCRAGGGEEGKNVRSEYAADAERHRGPLSLILEPLCNERRNVGQHLGRVCRKLLQL